MIRKTILGACAAFGLSGCEIPVMIAAHQNQGEMTGMFEITFPAVMLTQLDNGFEEYLTGTLIGHISGSATYDLTGPTWGHCTGTSTPGGISTLTCDIGSDVTLNTGAQRAQMTGTNVAEGTVQGLHFVSAIGWGNDANEAAVRAAIQTYRLNQQ